MNTRARSVVIFATVRATFGIVVLLMGNFSEATASEDAIDFAADVRPLFNSHCVGCHGGVKAAGEFKVTSEQDVRERIDPSNLDGSILMDRITSTEDDVRMPPPEHGPPLSDRDRDVLVRWIRSGAVWQTHWSFTIPKPAELERAIDPIDVDRIDSLLRSSETNHSPRKPAEAAEWIRRATLAVTGLPPSLEEYDRFSEAFIIDAEHAKAESLDRLLASPRYGEHWASVWLDQVRYADSRGLGQDGQRVMWKYRDWVIDALNADMPFDEFTVQQIAGDLLPNAGYSEWTATAAHRFTQTNEEGGTDDEEFRVAAVVDRVNTIWQVWQGVSIGCAQCHDHPYDPIKHDDYYKFMAYWNSTSDWDLNEEYPTMRVPINRLEHDRYEGTEKLRRSLTQQLWDKEYSVVDSQSNWKSLVDWSVTATQGTEVSQIDDLKRDPATIPSNAEFHTVGTVKRDTDYKIVETFHEDTDVVGIRLTIRALDPSKAALDTEVGSVLSFVKVECRHNEDAQDVWQDITLEHVVGDEPFPCFSPRESLNEKSITGFGPYARIQYDRKLAIGFEKLVPLKNGSQLRITLVHRNFYLDSFPLVARRIAIERSDNAAWVESLGSSELQQLRTRLKECDDTMNAVATTTIPVVRELPRHLQRPTNVFIRGLFLTKGDTVEASVPMWLNRDWKQPPKDRLEFAHWMTDDKNPLIARVWVNRVWSRLWGAGLVVTEEDFGSSGELPTNQSLLDDLGSQASSSFQWSQKRLIREIILSDAYGASARVNTVQDPLTNNTFRRGPRIRLTAEQVRDSVLLFSGLLDEQQGGPPAHPPIPAGVWEPFQSIDKWQTPDIHDGQRYRRSIYTYVKRSIPYPMFAAFDAPSREFCTSRRLLSNTPIQALTTLNETTFIEAADSFANRIRKFSDTTSDRINFSLRTVTGENPSAQQAKILSNYVDELSETLNDEECWKRFALLILNLDRVFVQ